MQSLESKIDDLVEITENNISYGVGDEEYNMGMINAYHEVKRLIPDKSPSKLTLRIGDEVDLNLGGERRYGNVISIVKYRNNVYILASFFYDGGLNNDWFIYNKIIKNSWTFAPRVFLDKLDDEIGYDVIDLDSE